MVVLADLERARHPASSLSRRSRRGPDRCRGSESHPGLSAGRRARRRGSECRKSLHTPGVSCVEGRGRGRENIFEQINNTTSTTLYLHHDQQGSTRLLTSSIGTKEASFTYDAYGNKTGSTGTATTPLGYDAQYTNSDTGLIYLRAREYDPVTGQFMSGDPRLMQTLEDYSYGSDDPLNQSDVSGECSQAVAARIPDYRKPPPCVAHLEGLHGVARFSVQTSSTPTVTWGLEVNGAYIRELIARGYVPSTVSFTNRTVVNGRVIKGPPPKSIGISYTYHGSVGPRIFGNTPLQRGDIVSLTATVVGTAVNAKGGRVEFSATATGTCQVA